MIFPILGRCKSTINRSIGGKFSSNTACKYEPENNPVGLSVKSSLASKVNVIPSVEDEGSAPAMSNPIFADNRDFPMGNCLISNSTKPFGCMKRSAPSNTERIGIRTSNCPCRGCEISLKYFDRGNLKLK